MEQSADHDSQAGGQASDAAPSQTGVHDLAEQVTSRSIVETVPLLSLRPADSPRLNGEDKAHIKRLAEADAPLPPILVDRGTMRVIDGMHRLMAASMVGRETIDVIFYEGREDDIFLHAVQENVTHGLPLSQADRRAAAERIIATHPHMSDRAIGQTSGLAAKTVASIRKRSTEGLPQANARIGRDGRVRPLDSAIGRRRAAELLADQPSASLRDVARAAGISPATALDVRKRLERGDSPVPGKPARHRDPADAVGAGPAAGAAGAGPGAGADARDTGALAPLRFKPRPAARSAAPPDPADTVEKLMRDPSLRNNERGKGMLRLLHVNAIGAGQLPDVAAIVPPHCVVMMTTLARQYAVMWQNFAQELDGRARIIDPVGSIR